MLNPPLSLLSDDLLDFIVEHVAKLRMLGAGNDHLKHLSLSDRAFTQSCQKYIFRRLDIWRGGRRLTKMKNFLDDKPTFARHIRMVVFAISRHESVWLFNDYTLLSIFRLLAKSPLRPHQLHFGGDLFDPSIELEDPILIVRWFTQSFFSQTLTVLHLTKCTNIPLTIFLVCPRLKEIFLSDIGAAEQSYNGYPGNQCSGREAPLLEVLNYSRSHSLVEQMITPPPRFTAPVVLWSNLRSLILSSHDEKALACLQPILDAACNTLEELHLGIINLFAAEPLQLPLAGFVNLSSLLNLHLFYLYAIIKCRKPRKAPRLAVIHDLNIVLGTIPSSNKVTHLWLDFRTVGQRPFRPCLGEDWEGMFNEIIRISDRNPLEFGLRMIVSSAKVGLESENANPGNDELFAHIMGKAASLFDYPKICTHFWNPTTLVLGPGQFGPYGKGRTRCRR